MELASQRGHTAITAVPRILLLLLLSLLALSPAGAVQNQTLVIRNVTVINTASDEVTRPVDVVISGNRITGTGRSLQIPHGAEIVDGTGKYLIPGLWDMHVHLFNNTSGSGTNNKDTSFPLLIANGVTGIRDMWSDPDDIELASRWTHEIEAGTLVGPRMALGSRIVDGVPTFLPNLLGVATAEEGRRAVRTLKSQGAGFIKVYWNLSPEAYFAIADESRELGIVFAGHVPFSVSAGDASDAGQKSIEHLTGLLEACSSKEAELRKQPWTPAVGEEIARTYDAQKCGLLFKRFAKNRTWHTPTAVLHRGISVSDDVEVRRNDSFRYVPAATMKRWMASPQVAREPELTIRKDRFEKMLGTIGEMHRAGVPLLTGSDVGNPFVVAGFSVHDELQLLVQAGLTPREALRTATLNAATYLDLADSLGTVKAGTLADLVLLDADPLENIANTRRITAVVTNGRYLPKAALQKMLSGVEAAALK